MVRGELVAHEAARLAAGLLLVLIDVGGRQGGPEGWELMCGNLSYPEDFDAEEVLADYWDATRPKEAHEDLPGESDGAGVPGGPEAAGGTTAPFGRAWPGLAEAGRLDTDPGARAAEIADTLVDSGSG